MELSSLTLISAAARELAKSFIPPYAYKSPKLIQGTGDKMDTSLKAFCCHTEQAMPNIMKQKTRWTWGKWELKIL